MLFLAAFPGFVICNIPLLIGNCCCRGGIPEKRKQCNKFTSDIFNNFISSFLKIFYHNFFFSKKEDKRGVYGDINRNIKWNHKKRWPHFFFF